MLEKTIKEYGSSKRLRIEFNKKDKIDADIDVVILTKTEYEKITNKINSVNDVSAIHQHEIEKQQNKLDSLKLTYDEKLTNLKEMHQKEIATIKDKHASTIAEYDSKVESLKNEVSTNLSNINLKNKEIALLKDSIADKDATIDNMQTKLEMKEHNIADIHQQQQKKADEHASEILKLSNDYSEKLSTLKDELSTTKESHAKNIGSIKEKHAKDVGTLKQEHQKELTNHVDNVRNSFLKESVRIKSDFKTVINDIDSLSWFDIAILRKHKKIIADYDSNKTFRIDERLTTAYISNNEK